MNSTPTPGRLFQEVRIESAEQAEALPLGAVAVHVDAEPEVQDQCAIRVREGWEFTGSDEVYGHGHVYYMHALVPVEAREERYTVQLPGQTVAHDRTRLVTPWGPAASA